jgi:hypothetical protein
MYQVFTTCTQYFYEDLLNFSDWELLRECTRFLKEYEKNWKQEEDKNCKVAKNTRLRKAKEQK